MKTELRNTAHVAGTVSSEVTTYKCKGEDFLSFILAVQRQSGAEDKICVNVSTYLVKKAEVGDKLDLVGQVRTYNKTIEGKNRLIVVFFAQDVKQYAEDCNEVEIKGFLCKEPRYRNTPLGREICDVMIAVQRERQKSDYIPCLVWGRTGRHLAETLDIGAEVVASGRLQSREYEKTCADGSTEIRTAYEVSINRIRDAMEVAE